MVELADIVRQHGQSYLQSDRNVTAQQRRALEDIAACHTHLMGGVCKHCPNCGESKFVGYSCRNRACPRCHGNHAAIWLEARLREMLPVPHYHIVFTLPHQLRELVRANADKLLALFVRCCAQTILQLAADPKWIGGQPALLTVLHTARRDLGYHPHVHCVVSAGGYDDAHKQWVGAPKPNYLFPQAVLGTVLRQKLLDGIRQCMPGCKLPKDLYKFDWVVNCEGSNSDSSHVLRYLARYVFRLPLCNGRIVEADEQTVVYRYRPNASKVDRLLKTDPHSFLERYLQHVLPKGFHAVRYWGLWSAPRRSLLQSLHLTLPRRPAMGSIPIAQPSAASVQTVHTTESPERCLRCGTLLEHIQVQPQPRRRLFRPFIHITAPVVRVGNVPP